MGWCGELNLKIPQVSSSHDWKTLSDQSKAPDGTWYDNLHARTKMQRLKGADTQCT